MNVCIQIQVLKVTRTKSSKVPDVITLKTNISLHCPEKLMHNFALRIDALLLLSIDT